MFKNFILVLEFWKKWIRNSQSTFSLHLTIEFAASFHKKRESE